PARAIRRLSCAPPPAEGYTLSLHDALPIWRLRNTRCNAGPGNPRVRSTRRLDCAIHHLGVYRRSDSRHGGAARGLPRRNPLVFLDRKSTRLNSSHVKISYAVFRLKKKNSDE